MRHCRKSSWNSIKRTQAFNYYFFHLLLNTPLNTTSLHNFILKTDFLFRFAQSTTLSSFSFFPSSKCQSSLSCHPPALNGELDFECSLTINRMRWSWISYAQLHSRKLLGFFFFTLPDPILLFFFISNALFLHSSPLLLYKYTHLWWIIIFFE